MSSLLKAISKVNGGDVNGDGRLDVAFRAAGSRTRGGGTTVLLEKVTDDFQRQCSTRRIR
jgi:hypothetical protein